ncbi:MAG: hypothetical protein U0572_11335 [Phycisphaerales bacterium]
MRQVLIKLLLFAIGGAILTLATASGSAIVDLPLSDWGQNLNIIPGTEAGDPFDGKMALQWSSLLGQRLLISSIGPSFVPNTNQRVQDLCPDWVFGLWLERRPARLLVDARGFPFPALWGAYEEFDPQRAGHSSSRRALVVDDWFPVDPRLNRPRELLIPFGVLGAGFAADTAIFGCSIAILVALPGQLRARRRRRHDRCAACGYQVGPLARCPECGRPNLGTA